MIAPVLIGLLGLDLDLRGLPGPFQKVTNIFELTSPELRTVFASAFIIGTMLLKNGCLYASSIASSNVSRLIARDLRERAVNLLIRADMKFFVRSSVGTISDSLLQEVDDVSHAVFHLCQAVSGLIAIIVLVAILISLSWQLLLATLLLLAVLMVVNQSAIKRSRIAGRQSVHSAQLLSKGMHEVFGGIRLVKATASEAREAERLIALSSERTDAQFHAEAAGLSIGPMGEVVAVLALVGIVWLSRVFMPGQLHGLSALLLTFLFVLFRMLPLISLVNFRRSEVARFLASADILSVLLTSEDKLLIEDGSTAYTSLRDRIEFASVSFSYGTETNLVLDAVSFSVPKGATIALVGQSGSGKTTCADLLMRFYEPNTGSITIDGRKLCDYELRSLRRSVGVVSQDTFLFNDTLAYNIKYARPDASESEVVEVAARAHAMEFIERLPHGFDTIIGDRGVMLSGGERQRVAIARALLQKPDILILDEATSSLDSVAERLIQVALEDLLRDRTTLVIAHRLSTVQNADKIFVLHQGKVVESGSHSELMDRDGHYKRLYVTQFAEAVPS
jgi:ABC-type multidrug transport system fused ATPase/permease subunit